ncbi:hypothetical protein GCM10018779_31980 [Streptomyces griseocarneus]|nr:hypothetical protein GCM10018779_31980 [Streptomyces griseocarneus]
MRYKRAAAQQGIQAGVEAGGLLESLLGCGSALAGLRPGAIIPERRGHRWIRPRAGRGWTGQTAHVTTT